MGTEYGFSTDRRTPFYGRLRSKSRRNPADGVPVHCRNEKASEIGKRDRIVVDTGMIMAVVAYRSKSLRPVFDRARKEDDLVISNIILMQCARQADKKRCALSREEIIAKVRELCPNVVEIAIMPLNDLKARYSLRDESDLEVLYSADVLDADILITSDEDFYDPDRPVKGIRAKIMRPSEYLRRKQ